MELRLKKIPDRPTIYIDQGADWTFLKKFIRRNLIHMIQWSEYDGHGNKNITKKSSPSILIPRDKGRLTFNTSREIFDKSTLIFNMEESDKFESILEIVGKDNRKDAAHLDAAYINRSHIFLTGDKKDIFSNKEILESIIDLRIYYSQNQQQKEKAEEYIYQLLKD